jgi:hypothetical protein
MKLSVFAKLRGLKLRVFTKYTKQKSVPVSLKHEIILNVNISANSLAKSKNISSGPSGGQFGSFGKASLYKKNLMHF